MNNFYEIEGIEFCYINEWSDPYLIYNGHYFNYYDIESALWEQYKEEKPDGTEEDFENYMSENAPNVIGYLDDCIANGYNFTSYEDMVNRED